MSFYNTGNPVPSDDPRDLDDNAKHIDEIVNSSEPTFTDRLGAQRATLAGVLVVAAQAQESAAAAEGFAEESELSADRSESAASMSAAASNPYPTTADGIANTSGSGATNRFFSVPGTGSDLTILYRNDAGVAVEIGRSPNVNGLFARNIWFDPFGEFIFDRPLLGFGTRASYAGTLNLVSANTPYIGKPTLSTSGAGNVQRIIPLSTLGKKVGDQLRFLSEFQVAATGGQMTIYFRDSASAVISSFPYSASAGAGVKTVSSALLTVPASTSFIELRCNGGTTLELFAVSASEGFALPKVGHAALPSSYRNQVISQKNLWPDAFLRQYQAGIKYQDGWSFAQLAGVAIPGVVTTSSNSPFPDKNVIRLPTGAGQHDFNVDAKRLGLRLGMKVTVSMVIYSAQSINFSVFGRDAAGSVVGDAGNVSYTWPSAVAQEIRKTITVDQTMLDTVKFFQVRILNGQTVGATPIEICARGIFVGDTAPLLFDDCYADDKAAIERKRFSIFGESTLRETQKRLTGILFGSAITTQYKSAHIGDSYTHLPVRWMQPFATFMQGRFGSGGPGWVGFGNPDAGSGNINGQNWQGLTITVTGTWTSAYATAPGPDICSVASSNVANQYRVNGLPAGLSSVQLYALTAAATIEYSTDGGAIWTPVDLSVGSSVTVTTLTVPGTGFNLWVRPATGTCTLYGIDAQKASGHRVHKLGATGSSAAQWATQTATVTWKAGMTALDPNLVSIMLATNDQTGSTAPWIVGGYVETIISNVRLAVPLADIVVIMPAENQRTNNVKMEAYASVVRELCARLNVAFCDLQQDYGLDPADYASTSVRNWYSPDLIHPNPATDGGFPIAARMVKLLTGGI